MEKTRKRLEDFFTSYAARFNAALEDPDHLDVEATAGAFADYFVAAGPAGIQGGKNDDAFRAQIPIGYGFYRSIGTISMDITALELTQPDALHWMARVHWRSLYAKKEGGEELIEFDVEAGHSRKHRTNIIEIAALSMSGEREGSWASHY